LPKLSHSSHCALNAMWPACKPNFVANARITHTAGQAWSTTLRKSMHQHIYNSNTCTGNHAFKLVANHSKGKLQLVMTSHSWNKNRTLKKHVVHLGRTVVLRGKPNGSHRGTRRSARKTTKSSCSSTAPWTAQL